MKKCMVALIYLTISLFYLPAFSQTEKEPLALGLPGDNFNLYAVLDAFQNSPTLEEFERTINNRDSNINNLDLNNDNATDYIEVVSNKEGSNFSIVLRDALNDNEYQDVAVIEGHKNYSGKVFVQIIGDELLYGQDYIVEPSITETQNPAYVGNQNAVVTNTTVYYVNQWPIITYLFSPGFSVYMSPWHWGFYPSYWYSWRPVYYHVYWDYNRYYYANNYYRRASYIRYPQSHSYYIKRRQVSPIVRQNNTNGRYNSVYDGRTYKKPVSPIRRTVAPNVNGRQQTPSSSQQSTRRDAPSTTRQSTRQEDSQGTTRQVTPASTRSSSRPATSTGSSTRQVVPASTRSSSKPVTPTSTRSTTRTVTPAATRQQTKVVAPSATRSGSRNSNSESTKRRE